MIRHNSIDSSPDSHQCCNTVPWNLDKYLFTHLNCISKYKELPSVAEASSYCSYKVDERPAGSNRLRTHYCGSNPIRDFSKWNSANWASLPNIAKNSKHTMHQNWVQNIGLPNNLVKIC